LSGNRASNLRNFQCVSQAIAKVIGITASKNLRLGFQPAKGSRMKLRGRGPPEVVAVNDAALPVATPRELILPARRSRQPWRKSNTGD